MEKKQETLFEGIKPRRSSAGVLELRRTQGQKPYSAADFRTLMLQDMEIQWKKYGPNALKRLALADPAKFIAAAIALVPKQAEVTITVEDELREMTDDQLSHRIAKLAAESGTVLALERDRAEGEGEPDNDSIPIDGEFEQG